VHAFIYICWVGFVKCHEWRVACNRPTLACPRKIATAIAFEVALWVASVVRSVFMTSQLYQRLSALSVLSRYCWVVNACRLPPVIRCDTILMLFRSTSPLGDRASPPQVRLSVSDLSPQAVQASQQSLMGRVCCGALIQCARNSVTDLQAVPYRAQATWIGPEPGIG